MPDISPWLDMMNNQVVVEPLTSRNAYGVASYGSATPYAARTNNSIRRIMNKDGEQVVSRGGAIVASPVDIPIDSRITLDDGSQPLLLASNSEPDEDGGILYVRLYFA